MNYTDIATQEEDEAWAMMEKEAERDGLLKAERKTVWIGEFEFLECGAMGMESFQLCLIHRLHEVRECTKEELDTGLDGELLDWVVPSEYKGEISFSQSFMRNLGGNIKKFEEAV